MKNDNLKIAISGLKNQKYEFDFELNESFFKKYTDGSIKNGKMLLKVQLQKSETMIQTNLHLKGNVILVCDRSLEEFEEPLEINDKMIFKFGDKPEVQDIGLEVIVRDTHEIDLENTIYEIIGLALPIKKLHPQFRNEKDENPEEDSILVYSSVQKESKNSEDLNENIDPRWAVLAKLKNN
jgi:uncharacterized metal-binding protein YceD (DUF177 family)